MKAKHNLPRLTMYLLLAYSSFRMFKDEDKKEYSSQRVFEKQKSLRFCSRKYSSREWKKANVQVNIAKLFALFAQYKKMLLDFQLLLFCPTWKYYRTSVSITFMEHHEAKETIPSFLSPFEHNSYFQGPPNLNGGTTTRWATSIWEKGQFVCSNIFKKREEWIRTSD